MLSGMIAQLDDCCGRLMGIFVAEKKIVVAEKMGQLCFAYSD